MRKEFSRFETEQVKKRLDLQLREVFVDKDYPMLRRWEVVRLNPTGVVLRTIGAGQPVEFRKHYREMERLLQDGILIGLGTFLANQKNNEQ